MPTEPSKLINCEMSTFMCMANKPSVLTACAPGCLGIPGSDIGNKYSSGYMRTDGCGRKSPVAPDEIFHLCRYDIGSGSSFFQEDASQIS
ncbi:hypothetical protein ElyMa_000934600 [Elysia marginata]|uniref:Uncharacterized protein n=1 Tax=Elysia marginata TaxID=1093978 RepID=A0AAV4HC02_9GAST|nr:hypothetical protein ElyMa_000934600 [Elysia marginata]